MYRFPLNGPCYILLHQLWMIPKFPLRIALSAAALLSAILAFYFSSSAFSEDASFVAQETLESIEGHIQL